MCGRFSQHYTWQEVRDYYDLIPSSPASNMEPRYNIGPQSTAAIIRPSAIGLKLEPAMFWLVPANWKKPLREMKFSTFNAKSETLIDKKTFAPAWKLGQRAIVPVSGFYEWPRPKQKGAAPFFITNPGALMLSLAAIWTEWKDPEDKKSRLTFSLLTTEPNGVMSAIPHHRSPVVIDEASRDLWLHGEIEEAAGLLRTPDDALMEATRVSPYVNNIANQGPDCVVSA
ncbi:MAG: SOS response-associated peptidase [Pseudomonadota bacterium]